MINGMRVNLSFPLFPSLTFPDIDHGRLAVELFDARQDPRILLATQVLESFPLHFARIAHRSEDVFASLLAVRGFRLTAALLAVFLVVQAVEQVVLVALPATRPQVIAGRGDYASVLAPGVGAQATTRATDPVG